MVVLITLTTAGADTGPFDLYSDVSGYSVPFETGVLKATLVAGYWCTTVPNGTTVIRIVSTAEMCTNQIDVSVVLVSPTTTTTTLVPPTTTTTTTIAIPNTIWSGYPPVDEGKGSNPRVQYYSTEITGGEVDSPTTVTLSATEVDFSGGHGQLWISVDPEPDFSLKAWNTVIGVGGTNPYSLTFVGTTDVFFEVISGSSNGDYTEIEVEIVSTSQGVVGTPYVITLTGSTAI